ncbi:MAG: hypothetical protein V4773_21870 [Verrucomicrobiota bacterium]
MNAADATASGAPEQAGRRPWGWMAAIFGVVLAAQLWLVAVAGTDIPYQDQWDVEGGWLYPATVDGSLQGTELLRPHNEHRIVWTHALNLLLFKANGQWDPLVQMSAGAGLRAALAALLGGMILSTVSAATRGWVALGVTVLFLPHLAWHNVLWGFQSQVYFVLLFSVAALWLLAGERLSWRRQAAALALGMSALLAMGAGALVPAAVGGLLLVRWAGRRPDVSALVPVLALLGAAWVMRVAVPAHEALRPQTTAEALRTAVMFLSWPHVGQPLAALALNLPLLVTVATRVVGQRQTFAGENFALALTGWGLACALAVAAMRGGGREFEHGVPSRYVDFVSMLVVGNVWLSAGAIHQVAGGQRKLARTGFFAWLAFLFVGWLGLSAQVWRGIVRPRAADREAPVRLAVEFQRSGNAEVFAGQPLLFVPHPNPESIRRVLKDPRLEGKLPPSLQPERPVGPLSRAVRTVVGDGER